MGETILRQGAGYIVVLTDEAKCGVPYRADVHDDGNHNHGFVDLRDRPELAITVPEASKSEGLLAIMLAVNRPGSAFLSIGCDCCLHSHDAGGHEVGRFVESYLGLAYRRPFLNDPSHLESLAVGILERIGAPEGQICFQMVIEPLLSFFGTDGSFGLNIHVYAFATDDEVAWEIFRRAGVRVAAVIDEINDLPGNHPLIAG